jgi:hypothetical protein
MGVRQHNGFPCGQINRRTFLADLGMGFAGLAMGSMLASDGIVRASTVPPRRPAAPTSAPLRPAGQERHLDLLSGGVSHLETFDPKPKLNELAGKTYDQTKLPNPQKDPLFLARSRSVVGKDRDLFSKIMPLQVGSKRYGPVRHGRQRLAAQPRDVRGRHRAGAVDVDDRQRPRRRVPDAHGPPRAGRGAAGDRELDPLRAGVAEREPAAVRVFGRVQDQRVKQNFSANYLGPEHAGVQLALDPGNRCRSARGRKTCRPSSSATSSS